MSQVQWLCVDTVDSILPLPLSSSVTEGSHLTSLCSFSVCKVEMIAPASQAVVRITLISTFKCYNSAWHVASAALSVSYYYFRFEGNDSIFNASRAVTASAPEDMCTSPERANE